MIYDWKQIGFQSEVKFTLVWRANLCTCKTKDHLSTSIGLVFPSPIVVASINREVTPSVSTPWTNTNITNCLE